MFLLDRQQFEDAERRWKALRVAYASDALPVVDPDTLQFIETTLNGRPAWLASVRGKTDDDPHFIIAGESREDALIKLVKFLARNGALVSQETFRE